MKANYLDGHFESNVTVDGSVGSGTAKNKAQGDKRQVESTQEADNGLMTYNSQSYVLRESTDGEDEIKSEKRDFVGEMGPTSYEAEKRERLISGNSDGLDTNPDLKTEEHAMANSFDAGNKE